MQCETDGDASTLQIVQGNFSWRHNPLASSSYNRYVPEHVPNSYAWGHLELAIQAQGQFLLTHFCGLSRRPIAPIYEFWSMRVKTSSFDTASEQNLVVKPCGASPSPNSGLIRYNCHEIEEMPCSHDW